MLGPYLLSMATRSTTVLVIVGSVVALASVLLMRLPGTTEGEELPRPKISTGDIRTDREDPARPEQNNRLAVEAVRLPQPLETAVKTVDAQPEEDLKDIKLETDPIRVRWRVLRFGLQEYRKLKTKNPLGSREGTLCYHSVGAILMASARGTTPKPGGTGTTTTHYMENSGLGYEWAVGEFPEYDAMRTYALAKAAFDDDRVRQANPNIQEPSFDTSNFDLMEARAEEAMALLEARYGFSQTSQ